MLEPECERLVREEAVAQYVNAKREQFVESVIKQTTRLQAESIGIDAVGEGLQKLHSEGYRYDEEEGNVVGYLHPEAAKGIYSDLEFVGESDKTSVHGVEFDFSPNLPDNSLLLIHVDATAPSLPSVQDFKPWCVKDSDGLLLIETSD